MLYKSKIQEAKTSFSWGYVLLLILGDHVPVHMYDYTVI